MAPESVVLIRHCEKAWANGKKPPDSKGYGCDPPIIETNSVINSLKKLKRIGFQAERVYSSPFLRCRQTAEIVSKSFEVKNYDIECDLREFLGNQKNRQIELDPITRKHLFRSKKQMVETFAEFQRRVQSLSEKDDLFLPGTIIVSHQLVIKNLVKYLLGEDITINCGEAIVLSFDSSPRAI